MSNILHFNHTGGDEMKLTMLGTGNALVTRCYNTCFAMQFPEGNILVDGGGGSEILARLARASISLDDIHHIIVTHKHIDHILGIIWLIRIIAQHMNKGIYSGDAYIYGHEEVIALLRSLAQSLLDGKQHRQLDTRIHLMQVEDGTRLEMAGHAVTFFDIHSTKTKQYGFSIELAHGDCLTCCGDEPCNKACEPIVRDSAWLLHEAFCLHSDAEIYKPYEKHHSTVRDAAMLAERLHVRNLLLYHTEDDHIRMRKVLYTAEAAQYYSGRIFVPDDMETIVI